MADDRRRNRPTPPLRIPQEPPDHSIAWGITAALVGAVIVGGLIYAASGPQQTATNTPSVTTGSSNPGTPARPAPGAPAQR